MLESPLRGYRESDAADGDFGTRRGGQRGGLWQGLVMGGGAE